MSTRWSCQSSFSCHRGAQEAAVSRHPLVEKAQLVNVIPRGSLGLGEVRVGSPVLLLPHCGPLGQALHVFQPQLFALYERAFASLLCGLSRTGV